MAARIPCPARCIPCRAVWASEEGACQQGLLDEGRSGAEVKVGGLEQEAWKVGEPPSPRVILPSTQVLTNTQVWAAHMRSG